MTSQGQRFRRRALRRGYKVDEVDAFLDRVEETLAGDPVGTPVTAQEVHDVVFRVRFGGYDEWQVDLHLDRVERQLAELEERGGYGRELRKMPDRIPSERMPPERMPPERMPPADRMAPPPPDRLGPPVRDERVMPPMGPPGPGPMPPGGPGVPPGVMPPGGPGGMPPAPPRPAPAGPPQRLGRYDEPTYGGGPGGPGAPPYEEFEPGRHGKADMTTEMGMPSPGFGAPPAPEPGIPGGGPGAEAQRIDQLRRTFQPRRFGSGYDRVQVDRLFDTLVASLSGRSAPPGEAELDPSQFDLVPGGYFEAEVDAALKEVRDILGRRR